jgi:two-component system LytT family response regulator
MRKFHELADNRFDQAKVNLIMAQLGERKKYKSCFLLPERDKYIPVSVEDIAYIYIDAKSVKLVTMDQKAFYLSHTLDDLMAEIDPHMFFRANRQFIVSRKTIKDVAVWFGNKLSINLSVETPEKIIVSKARVGEFKSWFTS